MTARTMPVVRLGRRSVPIVLPNRRDPRLHLSMVIVSIHIIGITALGFRVSVPQILSAIAAAGAIDGYLTYRKTHQFVWPASGILTGSGVALILRLVGMGSGEYWVWTGWYYFAGIAAFSVLSKYLIRWRGSHLFNPSNFGLVVAFLVIGRTVIEPLDFWWAPMSFWMGLAYLIIIVGGLLITRRLRLLEMALVFWVVLAVGLGVLVASGHCMAASWSLTPVCGASFWWVIITSPEILIFLFFMITDPKTVPEGRAARVVFSSCLALVATALMAPQTLEFGAKVGLLASLVILSPIRGLFDRALHDEESESSGLRQLFDRIAGARRVPARAFAHGTLIGGSLVALATLIVVLGGPARIPAEAAAALPSPSVDIDPSTLPPVTVEDDVETLKTTIGEEDVDQLALALAEDLAIEGEAILIANGELLTAADAGARLTEMLSVVNDAIATGVRTVPIYEFETLSLRATTGPGGQSASLAFDATGIVTEVAHDALGAVTGQRTDDFSSTFVISQVAGERWLIVEVTPIPG